MSRQRKMSGGGRKVNREDKRTPAGSADRKSQCKGFCGECPFRFEAPDGEPAEGVVDYQDAKYRLQKEEPAEAKIYRSISMVSAVETFVRVTIHAAKAVIATISS